MNFLYVFLGGGLGAITRYGISRVVQSPGNGFPLATFCANVLSCILLGLLMGWVSQRSLDAKSQLLLMTGFCGGFSTFSTFSAETFKLIEGGQMGIAILYIGASIAVCLACIGLGLKLAGI